MNTITRSLLLALGLLALGTTTVHAQRPSIATLQARITTLENNNVPNLADYVKMDTTTPGQPVRHVNGANLQVTNGLGSTQSTNGVGNVIVGYDEPRTTGSSVCSLGQYTDQTSCVNGGGIWALSHKSGSHNLVVGQGNAYSSDSGIVSGGSNVITNRFAGALGGVGNIASGLGATVLGGTSNTSSGPYSTIAGGATNTAAANSAAVMGGQHNTASGIAA